MIRSIFTRFLVGIALFFASLAWSGWAYLHTVADPHRAEAVADAVLADPAARVELATPLADQIVELAGLDASVAPEIRDAVVAAMADPRIVANLTAAVGSAHARAFGVPDPRPATIDGAQLVAAVREHLAVASPQLAERIPADLVGQLKVPEWKPPFIAGIRRLAEEATKWLGAAAIGLLTFALLAGDRARTLRSYGFWAISAGLAWALGPRLVVLAAKKFATSIDATLAAGVGAATNTVTVVATGLVATGIAALVGSRLLRLAPSRDSVRRTPAVRSSVREARPLRRPEAAPTRDVTEPVVVPVARTTVTPVVPAPPPISTAPTTVQPVVSPAGPPDMSPVGLSTDPGSGPTPVFASDLPLSAPVTSPLTELDPWAYFSGPAIDPKRGRPLPSRPDDADLDPAP